MKAIINHAYKVIDIINDDRSNEAVDIPADVQRIKPGVFAGWPNLRKVRISIYADRVPYIKDHISKLFDDNAGIEQITDVVINITPSISDAHWYGHVTFTINEALLATLVETFPNISKIEVTNVSKRKFIYTITLTSATVAYYQRIGISLNDGLIVLYELRRQGNNYGISSIASALNTQDLLVSIYRTPITNSYKTERYFQSGAIAAQALNNLLLIPGYAASLLDSSDEDWRKANLAWLKAHYKAIFLDAIQYLDSMDGLIVRVFALYQKISTSNASTYEQLIESARKYNRTILLSYLLDEFNHRFDASVLATRKEERAISEVMDPYSVSAMRRTLRFSVAANKEEVCIIGLKTKGDQHDNLVIPSRISGIQVTTLREKCFAVEENIGAIDLSQCNLMRHIPSECFSGCAGLSVITLPPNLLDIEELAIAHCASLQICALPDGMQSIGEFAFSGSGPNYVTTPASLRVIGRCAYGYSKCTAAHIKGAPYMDHSVFQGSAVQYCQLDGVTAITNRTFADCTSLATVIAPKAQAIDHEGFVNCASLETVVLSGDIIYVAHDAFGGALHIKRILLAGGGDNAATEKVALFPPHLRSIVRAYDPVRDSVYLRNI